MKNENALLNGFLWGVGVLLLSAQPVFAATATAQIRGTAADSPLAGEVRFEEVPDGLHIRAEVKNAPPGQHGFHIHETGSCAEAGKAAGGHFNPDGVPHGLLEKDGFAKAHAGDLGNIEIGPDGGGKLEVTLPTLNLKDGDKYGVAGRAVIFHEKVDDFGQPTGNAGGRIGCGVIELTS